MTAIDWKTLAPKRADWERLSAAFRAAGLPHCRWLNGIPEFDGDVDWDVVEAIATGKAQPSEQPVKRGRGRQKRK